jgi:hypothetical protein
MEPRLPAVVQNVLVIAAGILEGVGTYWEAVEGFVLVNPVGESENGGGEPRGVEGYWTEGVAEDASNVLSLYRFFFFTNLQRIRIIF